MSFSIELMDVSNKRKYDKGVDNVINVEQFHTLAIHARTFLFSKNIQTSKLKFKNNETFSICMYYQMKRNNNSFKLIYLYRQSDSY
jgi:hypothetical protein